MTLSQFQTLNYTCMQKREGKLCETTLTTAAFSSADVEFKPGFGLYSRFS